MSSQAQDADAWPGPAAEGGRGPAVELDEVVKSFGATRALRGVTLAVERGTIHALVGENGAGKSTCLGVIAGRVSPDRGALRVMGERLDGISPRRARAAGVAVVYQELTIVPEMSAQDNVFLGQAESRRGWARDRVMRKRYIDLCGELGVACHPDVRAGSLSVADQQLIEIMRAVVSDTEILLLDEPTAALAPHEREVVLRLMETLRARGVTIVFVSHNLDEVLRVSDYVTVFRDGTVTRQVPRSEADKPKIVEAMLGSELVQQASHRPTRPVAGPEARPLLRVESLTVPGAIEDISFDVWPGEIFGIAGLVGSGRTSVLRALAGATPSAAGRLWVDGAETGWPRTVRRARALGIALLPEDRKTQGLAGELSGAENIILGDLGGAAGRGGILTRRRIWAASSAAASGYGIDTSRLWHPASHLSGGNQQKLLLARWSHSPPRVLLADEPTRGIDVGAKEEILGHLRRLAEAGWSIVIVSSELEEIIATSNRILVLAEGRALACLDNSGGELDERDLIRTIFASSERSSGRDG